ncbi:MAG: hypothetical protein JST70_02790 [Bacteroidetes bacterium]|nr:hypothetical protein [Bacteroidota bacterium]
MKKILFLMAIAITIQFAAKAQVTTCPGYTFPGWVNTVNSTKCDVDITLFVVDRKTCLGLPSSPSFTFTIPASTPGTSHPLPSSFLAAAGSGVTNVIMAQLSWSSNTGCDGQPSTSIEADGPIYGTTGTNCFSCGLYVGTGSGSVANMPACQSCNPSGTAHIVWDPIGGAVSIQP